MSSKHLEFWAQERATLDGLPDGAGLNMAHEAVDRHVCHRGDQAAMRFVSGDGGITTLTYRALAEATSRFANALIRIGISAGDHVYALAGRTPELYIAALGTLKAKGVFSALFTNFGPEPLRLRINAGPPKVLVTTDTLYRRRIAPMRSELASLHAVIIIGEPIAGTLSFADVMAQSSDTFKIPSTNPGDPALIHFTSGTTGSPKGAVHAHEAVVAHSATARLALGLSAGETFWCTADPGWVTGISYGFIAPLAIGATAIIDTGEFDPRRWYRIVCNQQVACWYTSPTALRMLMMAGTALARTFSFSHLRLIASIGEPLNPEICHWGQRAFGRPIHDTWWQTETGAIVLATTPEEEPVPGAVGRALPGFKVRLAARRPTDEMGHPPDEGSCAPLAQQTGELAIAVGWPSMFRSYWNEPERYESCFSDGYYLSGDLMREDADGRFWFVSRADETIKSAGHLIGPFEIENVLIEHPAVAEAGVIGKPDAIFGEIVKAFISLRPGHLATSVLAEEILRHARIRLGPTLAPREIAFSPALPKTRSGKIMRRVLKARELGITEATLPTIDEPPSTSADSQDKDLTHHGNFTNIDR